MMEDRFDFRTRINLIRRVIGDDLLFSSILRMQLQLQLYWMEKYPPVLSALQIKMDVFNDLWGWIGK